MVYFNTYPYMRGYTGGNTVDNAFDQNAMKNCILDLHNAILQNKFIHVVNTEPDMLDINNIPPFDHTAVTTTGLGVDTPSKYLCYAFNDEISVDYPLFLTLRIYTTTFIARTSTQVGAKMNTSKLQIDVYVGLAYKSASHGYSYNRYHPSYSSTVTSDIVSYNSREQSEIINEDGLLYMYICPNVGFDGVIGSWPRSTPSVYPLILFIVDRKADGRVFSYRYNSTTSNTYYPMGSDASLDTKHNVNVSMRSHNDSTTTIYTSDTLNIISPPVTTYGSTIKVIPTQYYTDKIVNNYNVLLVAKNQLINTSRIAKFPIKISDTLTYYYKAISPATHPWRFNDDNTMILIKVGEKDDTQ